MCSAQWFVSFVVLLTLRYCVSHQTLAHLEKKKYLRHDCRNDFKIFTKRSVLRRNGSISFILPNDCNHFARSDSMWKSSGASQMKTHAQTAPLRRIY